MMLDASFSPTLVQMLIKLPIGVAPPDELLMAIRDVHAGGSPSRAKLCNPSSR